MKKEVVAQAPRATSPERAETTAMRRWNLRRHAAVAGYARLEASLVAWRGDRWTRGERGVLLKLPLSVRRLVTAPTVVGR